MRCKQHLVQRRFVKPSGGRFIAIFCQVALKALRAKQKKISHKEKAAGWADKQEDQPPLATAIRLLVEIGLRAKRR
jgi:hypothetical protein